MGQPPAASMVFRVGKLILMSRPIRNRTIRRAIEKQLEKTASTKPSPRSKLVKILSVVIGIPGILAALVYFVPRLTVTVSDPVDANDPLSSSVTVTNTGVIPLQHVIPGFCFDKITTRMLPQNKPRSLLGDCHKQTIYIREWHPHDLGLDESFTFSLNQFLGSQPTLVSAQIAIVVQYRLPWIHLNREKRSPLFAKRQTNGNFYWYYGSPSLPDSN